MGDAVAPEPPEKPSQAPVCPLSPSSEPPPVQDGAPLESLSHGRVLVNLTGLESYCWMEIMTRFYPRAFDILVGLLPLWHHDWRQLPGSWGNW